MLRIKHSLNMPILVSYFPITLFVLTFFTEIHASQISTVMPSQTINTEPLTLETADYQHIIIIHPEQVNIYKSKDVYPSLTPAEFMSMVDDANLRIKCWLNHDKTPNNKKITGDEYTNLLKQFKGVIINSIDSSKLNRQKFMRIFELMVNTCHINLHYTHLLNAIYDNNADLVKLLLLLGANITEATKNNTTLSLEFMIEGTVPYRIKSAIDEVYLAREAEQRIVMQLVKQKIGSGTSLGKEIIEYLLGKDHKVCAIKK